MAISRDRLVGVANRLLEFINTKTVDPENLANICEPDISVPIPYPGSTADLAGLVAVTEKIHGASPDFEMAFVDSIVDVTDCKVVYLLNTRGTQVGYYL